MNLLRASATEIPPLKSYKNFGVTPASRILPKRVRPRKRKTEQVRFAVGPPELFQSLSR